jgi:hypothetical protein
MAYILELPLLITLSKEIVDIVSLSVAYTHDARGYGLLVISNAAITAKLVGNLAITEALLTHLHHELIVGVQLMRDTLVVRRQSLPLFTVATAESAGYTRRWLSREASVFV